MAKKLFFCCCTGYFSQGLEHLRKSFMVWSTHRYQDLSELSFVLSWMSGSTWWTTTWIFCASFAWTEILSPQLSTASHPLWSSTQCSFFVFPLQWHEYYFSSLIGKLLNYYINANDPSDLLSSTVFSSFFSNYCLDCLFRLALFLLSANMPQQTLFSCRFFSTFLTELATKSACA